MSDHQGKTPDFSSLTENLSQQQAKISALKELVRQSEQQQGKNTASAQEKVKNIAQRLSNLKSKTNRTKANRSCSEVSEDLSMSHIEEEDHESIPTTSQSLRAVRSETPGSEKISLLRKQMELNRMKMAERENKSKEIEQMVTQLRSKFETSQMSLERSVELGKSMGDLSLINTAPSMLLQTQNRSFTISDVSQQQTSQPINLENERIKFLEKRIQNLETELNNKAKNVSESEITQRLEAKIMDLEECVREKESLIEARTKAVSLLTENLSKKKKDVVDSLEETKQEMFKMQETFLDAELTYKKEVSKLSRSITEKSAEIKNLNEKCEILEKSRYDLTLENSDLKTKLEDVQDYSTKISELNKLNETLQKRISTLESQKYEFITEEEIGEAKSAEEKKDEEKQISDSDELLQKLKEFEELLKQRDEEIEKLQEDLQEKVIEVNVINANMVILQEKLNASSSKPLFSDDSNVNEESQAEIAKLKQQLDESNKNMIKTKLKMKQMQKQIDALQKPSDDNQDLARLNLEIQTLTQKIAELEEEKGSYQLQLVGKDCEPDLDAKLKVLETTCQNQTTAIQLLEEQKVEMSEDLAIAKQELETIRNSLREEELEGKIKELEEKLYTLSEEKEEINVKMNRYLNENMELLDKLEKLSKGSSAESIEMVNLLTAHEKLEIEQYQKGIVHKDEEVPVEISQELNESLRNLRMESSELMEKIELFTVERREVLEKLDALTIENQVLSGNLDHVREEKALLEKQIEDLAMEKDGLEKLLNDLKSEKSEMSLKMAELSEHRTKLQDEINKLVKDELNTPHSSPSKAIPAEHDQSDSSSHVAASSIDKEACEKLLKQLDSEIQNLNKNKDKNQKLKISKKLSDNAKNVHAMMTNLLIEFYKNLDECKQLRDDLEKVKILLSNVSSDKNNEEVQNLKIQLNESADMLSTKNEECKELQYKIIELQKSNEDNINLEIEQLKSELENVIEDCSKKDDIISSLQDTIDMLSNERDHCESEVQAQMTLVSDLRREFDQLCADVKVNNQKLNEKSQELDKLQHEFDMRLKTSTNEVEILKTLVAEQKQLLIDSYQEHELDINQKVKEINDYQNQIKQLADELEQLKNKNAANQESCMNELHGEIKKLKDTLNECNREIENQKDELLHKQETIDTLNTQIIDLYKTMEENSNKLIEKDDELQYIQEIAESNRDEIRKTHEKLSLAEKTINELREQLSNKTREIELLQQKNVPTHDSKDDERIKQLEAEVRLLDTKNKEQLDKLKKYAANLKKKQAQCSELEEKISNSGNVDNAEFNALKAKVIQYEEQLNNVKVENNKLNESLQKSANQDELDDLKWKIDEYEEIINNKSIEIDRLKTQLHELSGKCDQIEESSYEFQSRVQTLEIENQKLAVNKELIEQLSKELEVAKKENQENIQKLQELDSKDDKKKMEKLKAAVVQFKHKLADKKKEVEELTAELNTLKTSSSSTETSSAHEIEDLKKQIKELDEMNEKILNDTRIAYDNDIGMLKQKIDDLEASNRLLTEDKQRKVSLEGQLETFEMTNIELREKIARLEEAVASIDAEKNALIREKFTLDKELEEKVNELACIEDNYTQCANNLIKQDELISKKLRETESDNANLSETIKEMSEEKNSLLHKISALETQIKFNVDENKQQINSLETLNNQMEQQIQQLHQEIKHLKTTHGQALEAKHAEIDEMETQFSSQLQKIEADKKAVQEALEKSNDQIIDFQDEVMRLKDSVHSLENVRSDLEREMSWLRLQNDNYTQDQLENEQLRMQLMQSETELENLRSQTDTMNSNHDAEVLILRQQISDLEAMRSQVSQNQTDDQVMLQNENIKLKELLMEKENEIQQKAIRLQMATVFDAPIQAVNDPFANLSVPVPQNSTSNEIRSLEEKLKQSQDEMEKIREAHMMANMELDVQSGKIHEILQENKKMQEKVREMQSMMDNLIRTNVELESSTERQKSEIERKDKEINEIKDEMSALRDHFNQSAQSTDDDKFQYLQSELAEKNHAIENLQKILQKYELNAPQNVPIQQTPTPNTSTPQAFTSSMFFNDPQPSTSSLFDDPFVGVNIQPVVEEEIKPKKAYLLYDSKNNVEAQTDECWLIEFNENANKVIALQNQLQMMEQTIMEQYIELEAARQKICELQISQKVPTVRESQEEKEIVPVRAYLCYDNVETQTNPEWINEYAEKIELLENQIKVMEVESIEKTNIQQLSQQTTSASLLFESSNQADHPMASLEIEDGWGWGSDNNAAAIADLAQIPTRSTLLSPRSDLEVRLQEQRDIVEKLEQEKGAINDELVNLRENSKKMMKKLKEYQQKIKELETRRGSSVDSNDMDAVIQEELNAQVRKLEARLKELSSEKEKEQQEKEGILKKLDVITTANERMLEMKERQDSQMEMYQLKIKDLSQKLQSLEEWGEDNSQKAVQLPPNPVTSSGEQELNKQIHELKEQIKDLQVDHDELQALFDEEKNNNKILEEKLSKINSNDRSKDEEIETLSQNLQLSRTQCDKLSQEINSKNSEIKELITKLDQLSNESVNIRVFLDDLKTQVDEKTNENEQLNERLKKLEVNNGELSQLYNQSIEQNYRQQIHELESKVQNLLAEIDFKTAQNEHHSAKIDEFSIKIHHLELNINGKDEEIHQLKTRLSENQNSSQNVEPQATSDIQQKLNDIEKLNSDLIKEKSQMEHELQVLNDQVLASLEFEDRMKNTVLELDAKDIEIQMLKATLDKFHSHPSDKETQSNEQNVDDKSEEIEKLRHEKEELERNMKSSIDLLNAQWSQMVEQRGNEVANSWKQHLEIRETEFAEIESGLRSQLEQKMSLSETSSGSKVEDNETIMKMKSIMESQEVEIVSLKEQLAIRSAEYAALSAKVDPYHQMSSMSISPISSADTDKVPRSELDLALYMLHQRDMRLEEMTMELVRLLEERDQLQLRLSNAIRQIEEFKKKINIDAAESSDQSTPEKLPPAETNVEDDKLKAKLSELNSVQHLRDKAIADDRETRFINNISMFQRDVANIPPEAAARIVSGSDQNQQSPSSVLMNWILGKNPESS